MGSQAEAERAYAVFESKVTRTVYVDNLSPEVTEAHIKAAIEQYANATVIKVQFVPNYTDPYLTTRCAPVEVEKAKQASNVVEVVNSFQFMICGTPRPVRALHAEEGMFEDRPPKPGRKIMLSWSDPIDQDFEVTRKLKELARKHQAESSYMSKSQWEEEELLANTQTECLERAYKHHVLLEKLDEKSLNSMEQWYDDPSDNYELGDN